MESDISRLEGLIDIGHFFHIPNLTGERIRSRAEMNVKIQLKMLGKWIRLRNGRWNFMSKLSSLKRKVFYTK